MTMKQLGLTMLVTGAVMIVSSLSLIALAATLLEV